MFYVKIKQKHLTFINLKVEKKNIFQSIHFPKFCHFWELGTMPKIAPVVSQWSFLKRKNYVTQKRLFRKSYNLADLIFSPIYTSSANLNQICASQDSRPRYLK